VEEELLLNVLKELLEDNVEETTEQNAPKSEQSDLTKELKQSENSKEPEETKD
jgi:hypothetical protein